MYSAHEVEHALSVFRRVGTYKATARETGISRAAIRSWHKGLRPGEARGSRCLRCDDYRFPVPGATDYAYAYLLGLYLGDGTLSTHPRGVYRLRVFLDRAYPGIIAECEAAIAILMPGRKVGRVRQRNAHLDEPYCLSKHWPCLFPQHGSGMKHLRPILLEDWQREILGRYPGRFLRGLIHSDGCRGMNKIKHPKRTYSYSRYEFSNRSDDIRGLFCEYCNRLGVDWRRMNRWTISVARRDSVALLDRHIGPKR